MADRRYKLLGQGLPGPSSFGVGDLVAGSTPQWNLTTESWDAVALGDTYYTETEVDALFTNFEPENLYYSGGIRAGTHVYGAYVRGDDADTITQFLLKNAAGTDLANFSSHPASGVYLYSYTHGQPMALIGEDAGGTGRTVVDGDPDGAATLYYAGSSRALTTTNGLYLGSGANVSPSSAGVGHLQINGSGYVGYITLDGTAMYIGQNSASRQTIIQADEKNSIKCVPNAEVQLNHNGNLALWTFSAGAIVQHPTSTDPSLYLYRSDGTRNGFLLASTSAMTLRQETHGLPLTISSENASGTSRTIISGDPDTYTDIYAAGYLGIRVGNATIGFFNNSGNAKQTVTGSRGGNAALTSLLAALANHGLITNSTT